MQKEGHEPDIHLSEEEEEEGGTELDITARRIPRLGLDQNRERLLELRNRRSSPRKKKYYDADGDDLEVSLTNIALAQKMLNSMMNGERLPAVLRPDIEYTIAKALGAYAESCQQDLAEQRTAALRSKGFNLHQTIEEVQPPRAREAQKGQLKKNKETKSESTLSEQG